MRIAIVNDMAMAVEALRRVLVQAPGHELAWVARDGAEAVAHCATDTPDLILMDLIMPGMDGVEATRLIMARTPCAIVVVTADVDKNCSRVFEAMGHGALDAVNTPALGSPSGSQALLLKIEVIRRLLGNAPARIASAAAEIAVSSHQGPFPLVAIGSSAGGPAALARIFSSLPRAFPGAIVVVQHVDAQFAGGLAAWLGQQTHLAVRLAREGDVPEPGQALLAGTGDHLSFVSPGKLGYVQQPPDSSYRPSIDVFFKSIPGFWQSGVLGVLLTGMGRDGAEGLKVLRTAGHPTLAQDRATSAVYGMPRAAVEMQAAGEVLPLDKIAPRLSTLVAQGAR